MAIKFPDILENNNPNFPLVDITSLRGVAIPLTDINLTGSNIPEAKRNPGVIVFDTTAQKFYGYSGPDATSLEWLDPANWNELGGGGGDTYTLSAGPKTEAATLTNTSSGTTYVAATTLATTVVTGAGDGNLTVLVGTVSGGGAIDIDQITVVVGGTGYAVGDTFNIGTAAGQDAIGTVASTVASTSVPLNLDAATGADSVVNLKEGSGVILTRNSAGEIEIEATAGGTYTNATATPQNFPGNSPFDNISSGTTFTAKTFTEMMDLMLYPTLFPSLSNPSLSGVNLSPNGFQIIGTLITSGNLTLSCTFNQGSINPQYTTATNKRSGLPNTYNYTSPASAFVTSVSTTALSNTVANTSTYTVTAGTNSFSVSVNYDIGPQPKDSIGGDFSTALAAGFNPPGSTSRSMTGVFPAFATTTNYNVTNQLPLQNMGNSDLILTMVLEDGTAGNKQALAVPNTAGGQAGFTAFTDVKQEDPLNIGQFVPITGGLTTFTLTTETRTVEGNPITYNLYTHNGGQIGARKLKFIN